MKKLMIAAAAAAMIGGAYAACNEAADCLAWNLSMKLKSVQPKKITCKDVCGEKSQVYYLDSATRSLKGYLWVCDYECDDSIALNCVLWDTKNKVPVIACPRLGDYDFTTVDLVNSYVFGKKANKVALDISFDADAIFGNAVAINGKIGKDGSEDCALKSASGYFSGAIAAIVKDGSTKSIGSTAAYGICVEKDEPACEEDPESIEVVYTTICSACCWDSWCDIEDLETIEDGDLVPAVGTWNMKSNKKLIKRDQHLAAVVPAYAL